MQRILLCAALLSPLLSAQMAPPPAGPLDPARILPLHAPPASHLTAQFIWTAHDAAAPNPAYQAKVRDQNDKIDPHFFRVHFHLNAVPREATLYLAGPRSATVYLNGKQVLRATDDGTRPKNLTVIPAEVASALRPGDNVLALEEVRGHNSLHTGASPTINQVTYGEVLAVKIVPRSLAVDAPPILVSNLRWRSTLHPASGWQAPDFDDTSWPHVESLGVLGSKRDFLQWNADAGLYAWPGYSGISSTLRVFTLPAHAIQQTTDPGLLHNLKSLLHTHATFAATPTRNAAPSLTLDLGREIGGRLRLVSASSQTTTVLASYGESPEEANLGKGYLGVRRIVVPPHATAFGPKSAFRYIRLTFPAGSAPSRWSALDAQGITYPVRYLGSFQSSDPLLNRIWETAAYTARLCMQEGIWDAPKRDRGRWMGDLDVTGRTITSVFGERRLMEQTMADVLGPPPVTRDVNTIVGYSALWITGQADFYRHVGDLAYLRSMHPRLLSLLRLLDGELDPDGLFRNRERHKLFVDWSGDLHSDTPEARAATHLELTLAYTEAAFLLDHLGDHTNASRYRRQAGRMTRAAQDHLLDPATHTFGTRWQTNAMAVVSGVATPSEQFAIWQQVLAHIGSPDAVITPYYGFYVLSAMARLNHRAAALDWMRTYWGGMLAEGATSFWEAYDPHWPKHDFHAFLEADNKTGYYVSLAHGWASGPAPWLTSQILGIQPTDAGFRELRIRPDLAGLAWARGAEPTPRGLVRVDCTPRSLRIALPPGTRATVLLPFAPDPAQIRRSGHPLPANTRRIEGRLAVVLTGPGEFRFTGPALSPAKKP